MFGIGRSCCSHLSSQEKLSLKPAPRERARQTCPSGSSDGTVWGEETGEQFKSSKLLGSSPFSSHSFPAPGGWITGGSVKDSGRKWELRKKMLLCQAACVQQLTQSHDLSIMRVCLVWLFFFFPVPVSCCCGAILLF